LTIIHILALGPVGGLLRVVEALALGQRLQGHDVHVVAVREPGGGEHPMITALEAAGVCVIQLELPSRGYLRERAAVAELCQRLRPHLVHTHGYRPDVVDGPVARRLGVPVVTTVHGFTGGDRKNRFYEWLQCRAYRRYDAVVAVSQRLAGELAGTGIAPARIHTVPNAWGETSVPLERGEARRALGLDESGFHIGWVGRVSHEKGLDTLLAALRHLGELPYTLSILGDGRERAGLEEGLAASPELAQRVRWHGIVADAGRYFPAFDLYLLSSRTEGTPIALFEAMAAGIPIATTNVGGVPDVVSTGEALLVPPEDPAALARAIRIVYDDPAAAATRARAARARLNAEFAFEPWIDRYDTIYRSLQPQTKELAER
jgi:glycosyltransferase involved in cell wall biosynthesis